MEIHLQMFKTIILHTLTLVYEPKTLYSLSTKIMNCTFFWDHDFYIKVPIEKLKEKL
jgi:hypothetical protein